MLLLILTRKMENKFSNVFGKGQKNLKMSMPRPKIKFSKKPLTFILISSLGLSYRK